MQPYNEKTPLVGGPAPAPAPTGTFTKLAAAVTKVFRLVAFFVVQLVLPAHVPRKRTAYADPRVGEYVAPREGDSRSPCPALNAMANHGYLPRDGRAISASDLVRALQHAFAISRPMGTVLAFGSLARLGTVGRVDLHDLARHGRIEHDASLVHANAAPGARYAPTEVDRALYEELERDAAAASPPPSLSSTHTPPSTTFLTLPALARARLRREAASPPLDRRQAAIARSEAAAILGVFGDAAHGGRVPMAAVRAFVRDERMPAGYAPRRETTLRACLGLAKELGKAMEELRGAARA